MFWCENIIAILKRASLLVDFVEIYMLSICKADEECNSCMNEVKESIGVTHNVRRDQVDMLIESLTQSL